MSGGGGGVEHSGLLRRWWSMAMVDSDGHDGTPRGLVGSDLMQPSRIH